MTNTTLQTVSINLPVPVGSRVEWRPPRQGERWTDTHGNIWTATTDGITPRFVLVPLFTPPQWLVESDYTSIRWRHETWLLHLNEISYVTAGRHHDLRDMLAKINPKQTTVAWERGK